MKKILLTSILLLISIVSFADATPKFDPQPNLEFYINNNHVIEIDSILMITTLKAEKRKDTLFPFKQKSDYFDNVLTYYINNNNETRIFPTLRTSISDFQLFLIVNGKKYQSEVLEYKGERSQMKFQLTSDGKIIDSSNLFYTKWIDYIISLIITLSLELLFILALTKLLSNKLRKTIFLFLIANLISHPLLWYFDTNFDINLMLLEVAVFLFETLFVALFIAKEIGLKKCVTISLFGNLISWIIGGIIFYIYMES